MTLPAPRNDAVTAVDLWWFPEAYRKGRRPDATVYVYDAEAEAAGYSTAHEYVARTHKDRAATFRARDLTRAEAEPLRNSERFYADSHPDYAGRVGE